MCNIFSGHFLPGPTLRPEIENDFLTFPGKNSRPPPAPARVQVVSCRTKPEVQLPMFPVAGPTGPIPGVATPRGVGQTHSRRLEWVDGPPDRRASTVQLRHCIPETNARILNGLTLELPDASAHDLRTTAPSHAGADAPPTRDSVGPSARGGMKAPPADSTRLRLCPIGVRGFIPFTAPEVLFP